MKSFSTEPKEQKVIEFEVDGKALRFTMPKRAGLIASVVQNVGLDARNLDTDSTRDLLNWLGEGLGEDDAQWLLDRLTDPDDDFDLDNVNEIAKYVVGQGVNRPTRRRRG